MTVRQVVNARTLGKRYAEIVRERKLPVQGIWVQDTPEGPVLWVLIEPMDLTDERPVHAAFVDLHNAFPDSLFDDHVLNPAWFPDRRVESLIPSNAVRVDLRT